MSKKRIDPQKILNYIPIKYRFKIKDPLSLICSFLDVVPWDDQRFLDLERYVNDATIGELESKEVYICRFFIQPVINFYYNIKLMRDELIRDDLLIDRYTTRSYYVIFDRYMQYSVNYAKLYLKLYSRREVVCPCDNKKYTNFMSHIKGSKHKRLIKNKNVSLSETCDGLIKLAKLTRNKELNDIVSLF